ncbi:uncharacterized protein LOC144734907 [Lampetra planeri]
MMMGSSSVAFPPEAGSAGMRCSEGIRRGEEIYINKLAMEQDEEDEEEDEENDDCIRHHHHHLHLVPGATTSSSSDAHRPPRMVTATAMGSPDDEPPDENDREDDGDGDGKDDGESRRWADRDASSRGATDDAAAVAADDENDDEDDDDEDADDEGGCDANGFGNAALRLSRLRMSMRSISPGRRHSWEPAKKRAVVESKRRSASVDELDSHSEGEEEEEQEVEEEEGAQMSTVVAEEHGEEGEDEVEDEEEVERKRRLAQVGGTVAERPQTLEGLSPPFGILHEHHDLSPDGEEARALGLGPMPYRKSAMMPHLPNHEPFINKSRSRSVSYVPSPERRTQSATLPSNMSLSSVVMTQADEPGVVSPSKPDGEKAGTRVARTFSFLKNRMTSTKNRNKSKTKEGKEKPPQGGAHRFASATFSSPTHCSHCGKGLGSRDALQCLSKSPRAHGTCPCTFCGTLCGYPLRFCSAVRPTAGVGNVWPAGPYEARKIIWCGPAKATTGGTRNSINLGANLEKQLRVAATSSIPANITRLTKEKQFQPSL